MSKLETLKFFLWKRSGLHLRDALARYYLYLSNISSSKSTKLRWSYRSDFAVFRIAFLKFCNADF